MAANQRPRNPQGNRPPQGGSRQVSAKRRKNSKGKIILFAVEIVIILIMVAVLYLVMTQSSEGPNMVTLDTKELNIPTEIQEAVQDEENGSRSDSTMIASINMDTGDIKLVSIYRDTYLNLASKEGDDYWKCNSAYSYGGAEQAIKMLNMNLDMDITDFVTVGYKGLIKVIDGLGGVYIDVDSEELKHINNYQSTIVDDVLKTSYTKVTDTGSQLLNGLQATAYCRIRYTKGDDFQRAARQREVLQAIEDQAKKADLATLTRVFNDAVGDIYTSLDTETILELLAVIADYEIVDEAGFPQEDMRAVPNMGAKGSCVVPVDLESNVVWLHQFLFDDEEYEVTDNVKEYGAKIAADAAPYLKNR